MLGLKIHYQIGVQVRILSSALKKENFKPVRTERSGSLRVAVNDLAGRKSKGQSTLLSREEQFGENNRYGTIIQAFKRNINGSR